jgi:hypothetical protein
MLSQRIGNGGICHVHQDCPARGNLSFFTFRAR